MRQPQPDKTGLYHFPGSNTESRNPELFKQKVQGYMRLSHNSQRELADALGLHPKVLSRKLSSTSDAVLTNPEVRQLVKILAEWASILTRSEAIELLALMKCPPFEDWEWDEHPLRRLEDTEDSVDNDDSRLEQGSGHTLKQGSGVSPDAVQTNNLPNQLTSFVGREREKAEIKNFLVPAVGERVSRLVTLTGTGGTGKTRLALQVAAEVLDAFPDGVWLVELASISAPAIIPQNIAEVLGVTELPGRPILNTLTEYLRKRHLLLVLDNCEHLIEECARLANSLLRICPKLQILVTSREALRLPGEITYPVPSLALPEPRQLPDLEQLREFEAIRLFNERAQISNFNFAVTEQNAPAVVELCRKLDGIPLAIELAAARTKILTVEQINDRLDDRFNLLRSSGNRAALPRQQTLRDLIDWSHNLLSEPEKILFRRLSIFPGGFTIEAAETVGSDENIQQWEILDLLSQLVNKSLALVEDEPGNLRYRYLETIRQYAVEKLEESREAALVSRKHFYFFLELAEEAYSRARGPQQLAWFTRLDREHDNFRVALAWVNGEGDFEGAIRLSGALGLFWYVRGFNSEGRHWLEEALNKGAPGETPESKLYWARAYNWAGTLVMMQAEFSQATRLYEKSLALSRELGDTDSITETLDRLGELGRDQGDYERSYLLLNQSLALARLFGGPETVSHILCDVGEVAWDQGFYEEARVYYQESLDLATRLENQNYIAKATLRLGQIARVQGDLAQAETLLDKAYALFQQQGHRWGVSVSLHRQGLVAFDRGLYDRAQVLFEQSLELFNRSGDRWGVAEQLGELGRLALAQGDLLTATRMFENSLEVYRKLGIKLQVANTIVSQGEVAFWEGDLDKANQLLQEGLEIHRHLGARPGVANTLFLLAQVTCEQADFECARALYEEGLALAREMGERTHVAMYLEGYAGLALELNEPELAAQMTKEARAIRAATGTRVVPVRWKQYEKITATVQPGSVEE